MNQHIDMTETIKLFYTKLKEMIAKDEKLATLLMEKDVDIKIKYVIRENLPEEVRPRSKM